MPNIFHAYWLDEKLDFNAEGQWNLPNEACLPSSLSNKISLPKPDLAMSFKLKSIVVDSKWYSDPIPSDLAPCLSPDGDPRCFPFLFMEVKKAHADLADAERANLYSASQALYNIFLWMARAKKKDEFFEKVRVFSFVFNVEKLSVRVHRAEKTEEDNGLGYCFDELFNLPQYTRDQVCLLLNSLLKKYAVEELHPILKETFEIVIKKQIAVESNKRRQRETRG